MAWWDDVYNAATGAVDVVASDYTALATAAVTSLRGRINIRWSRAF